MSTEITKANDTQALSYSNRVQFAKPKKETAMLVDVQYVRASKKDNTKDYLYIIWKDIETGEKYLQAIEEPLMTIYFEKPEYRNHTQNLTYAYIDRLYPKTVKYKDIIFAIAEEEGEYGKNRLSEIFTTRNYKALKDFYLYPYSFGADYDIRVWYRHEWMKSFDNDMKKPITKGFMDIETDTFESPGFPNPMFDPIDLVTVIDSTGNKSYTFCLVGRKCVEKDMTGMTDEEKEKELERRRLYELRHQTEDYYVEHQDELYNAIHEKFDESYPNIEFRVYFYKDEAKMITHIFQLINILKLDFIGIWNISFDSKYLYDRCITLGLDPKEVMCHPDFPVKECYFKKDMRNFSVKNKSDFFHISSYSVFFDQMITYAAIRKGQSELRSNKLTYIAKREIGDEKLDYSEIGNIKTLGYKDWLTYVLYNIKDVLLQKGIEDRCLDIDTYYMTSYQNLTPYENEFKQTVVLRNVQYRFYMKTGKVPGNNVNAIIYNKMTENMSEDEIDEKKSKFEGALVGNPKLIDNFGIKLFGKRVNNIFKYNIDFDMTAFYPSTIFAMNIDPSTLIFKMYLYSNQYDVRGGKIPFHGITDVQMVKDNKDSFANDVASEVMDNFQTGNIISTAHKWMNLPSTVEVFRKCMKKLGGGHNGNF
jgi:hypothetical protein